jgi:enoyl-CoA hydratase
MSILLKSDNNGVRILTMNRPERKNALSPELVTALHQAMCDADGDDSIRAVVLTGADGGEIDTKAAFCAGGDLGGGMQGDGFMAQHLARGGFAELLLTMLRMRTPTIAAVNGTAFGGGFGLVLACDLAIASDAARLGAPEVKRGLFPMMIAALIDAVLPRKAAMELMLLGGDVSGARLLELGIVNRICPRQDVISTSVEMANHIASMSPAVLSLGKRAVALQRDMPLEQKLMFLRDQLTLNLQLEDAAEGIGAFLDKREPQWRGR